MEFEFRAKDGIKTSQEFAKVEKIANDLLEFSNQTDILDKIAQAHKLGGKSTAIQKILEQKTNELGFRNEAKGLFSKYKTSGLRPDCYKKISANTGILLEVERGKTLANNMDMLDVWKCHICAEANYLFLIVPQIRQTKKEKDETVYESVKKRLKSFFDKNNYINVDALFIFGY
jgi:hypothetical protein